MMHEALVQAGVMVPCGIIIAYCALPIYRSHGSDRKLALLGLATLVLWLGFGLASDMLIYWISHHDFSGARHSVLMERAELRLALLCTLGIICAGATGATVLHLRSLPTVQE